MKTLGVRFLRQPPLPLIEVPVNTFFKIAGIVLIVLAAASAFPVVARIADAASVAMFGLFLLYWKPIP